jgi:hypothetical protein
MWEQPRKVSERAMIDPLADCAVSHVTASVTKEIREGKEREGATSTTGKKDQEASQPERLANRTTNHQVEPDQTDSKQEINQTSHREMTQEIKRENKQIRPTAQARVGAHQMAVRDALMKGKRSSI